jgi:VRR-NUC domain
MRKLKRPPEPSEYSQQCNIVKFCNLMAPQYPDLELINASMNGLWIPNTHPGIKNSIIEKFKWKIIKILKACGCLRKGFPDLNLPVPRKHYHGLYIELKKESGKGPSEDQKWWIRQLTKKGYYACVCIGENAAKRILIQYLNEEL